MKKILLATTMLASVAGYAAADVSVSGDARMGVVSSEGNSVFENRIRIKFTGSGTTDGGLSFGGSVRANEAKVAAGDDAGNKGSVYISGAFGKITFGSVDSGDAAAVGQLASVGYEGLGSGNSIGYAADGTFLPFAEDALGADESGFNGGAKVLYTYSAGAVTVNASTAQLSNGGANEQAYGVGVSYAAGALTLALGYGDASATLSGEDLTADGSMTDISASVGYVMGDTTIKAIYQDKELNMTEEGVDYTVLDMVSMGASVSHKLGAITLTGYAITSNLTSDVSEIDVSLDRHGIGASYDLGGGASVQGGWAEYQAFDADNEVATVSAVDAGVNFSF